MKKQTTSSKRSDPDLNRPCSVRRLLAGPLRRIQYFERQLHTCTHVAEVIVARRRQRKLGRGPRAKRIARELYAGARFAEDARGAIVRVEAEQPWPRHLPSRHALGARRRHYAIHPYMMVWASDRGCGFCNHLHPRAKCPLAPGSRRPVRGHPKQPRRGGQKAQLVSALLVKVFGRGPAPPRPTRDANP